MKRPPTGRAHDKQANRAVLCGVHIANPPRKSWYEYLAGESDCAVIREPVVGLFLVLHDGNL